MNPQTLIEEHFRLAPQAMAALKKLGIKTVTNLLYHFPVRYGDTSEMKNIASLAQGETAVVFGKISGLKMSKGFRTKIAMADGWIEDGTGKIKAVWFNQPYLAKMVNEGAFVRVEGKVSARRAPPSVPPLKRGEGKDGGTLYFSNPKIETVNKLPIGVGDSLFGLPAARAAQAGAESDPSSRAKLTTGLGKHTLYPVYPESRGVTSNWLYHAIAKVFKSGILENFPEPIPSDILAKYNLPSIKTALVWIHTPLKKDDAVAARKRFAFEEVFLIQLEKQKEKRLWQKEHSFRIEKTEEQISRFNSRLAFQMTGAQTRAVNAVVADFKKGFPMARLLEGDVGSGKTAVAAATAYATITSRPEGQNFGTLQVAYMTPTEILARQQFENFISFFSHLPVNIGLITSSGCQKFPSKINPHGATDISRAQLLKWVANGEIAALVGTHSLIQKSVKFKHLAYVIIDEQHRFGTAQRQKLVRKDKIAPHLLSMTATPIPRTLALTIYGDLDLTVLDEMPPGRKPVITEIVLPQKREAIYEKIRAELKAGRQAFVVCPRIDEPDPTKEMAVLAKSAKAEAKRLKEKIFPEFEIAVMHSKLKDDEKEKTMERFKDGNINILVSTSVVEVGVNVPNATVIIIEGAERFGLAQLHQLRGRVIRSNHQAYCYVFTESNSKAATARLNALRRAKDGFELAEYDLKFRGAGELSGTKQWGVSDIAMEALQNLKMVEAARAEAARLIAEDETLSRYPILAESVKSRSGGVHFE